MAAPTDGEVAPVRLDCLKPYLSLTILQCTSTDAAGAFNVLGKMLRRTGTRARSRQCSIIADGLEDPWEQSPGLQWLAEDAYRVDAFIVRQDRSPTWTLLDGLMVDTSHKLVVTFMRNTLVCIHTDLDLLRDKIQRWVDETPTPPFRRVPVGSQNAAYLRGSAKGLWLRGTHVRRASKADSKNLSGSSVGDALLPFHDSSFAMGSARASLPTDLGLDALSGTVGSTPRKSQLWKGPARNASEFFAQANEALVLLEDVLAADVSVDRPFPLLAVEEADLSNVYGAFEVSVLDPDDIRLSVTASQDLVEAAELLQDAALVVRGSSASPNFHVDVGVDGAIGGALTVRPERQKGKTKFRIGYARDTIPSDPHSTRTVFDALNEHAGDLITVYYESGHTVVEGGVYRQDFSVPPFQNWDFEDFAGYNRLHEKPKGESTPQRIHDRIGDGVDDSLFSWVAFKYSAGWLTCDDGPGEVADFVHVSPDGRLSLIHVKAASSDRPRRGISVVRYEVVASQAMKNIRYLTTDTLVSRLSRPGVISPASWTDGKRCAGRAELLEVLQMRGPMDPSQVVIVQPQVSRALVSSLRDADNPLPTTSTPDHLRLRLLDALLHSVRATVVGAGADDLRVVGSVT